MKHTNEELTEIFTSHKGDKTHAEYFIKKYETSYNDFEIDDDWEDESESLEEHTLNFCLEFYLPIFLKYLKIGHNPSWANEIALSCEEESLAVLDTYHKIKKENPALAKSEIELYSKSLSNEERIINYYLFLMEHDYVINVEERAANYTKLFKEEIASGKSEIYAHEYANNRVNSMGYSEFYSEVYATFYEKSLNEGRAKEYAEEYAEKMGDYLANNFSNLSQIKNDFDFDCYHEQVLINMKEWENNKK